MSADNHLYTDIARLQQANTGYAIPVQVVPHVENLSSQIEKTIMAIYNDVDILGRLIGETYQRSGGMDPMKRRSYESLYCILSNSLALTPSYAHATPVVPAVQQAYYDYSLASPVQSSVSSQTQTVSGNSLYEDQERIENDIFWSIVYDIFPEWKEKRTSIENAAFFHHYLEKKNYDNQHRFRGKTSHVEFVKRMELFLETTEKRGLDWKKCMRKLKRRCCDLIRYERAVMPKQSVVEMRRASRDYISLIGSLAQHNLSQMELKDSKSDSSERSIADSP